MSISMDTLRAAMRGDAQRLQAGNGGQVDRDDRRPGLFSFAVKREINAANRATAERIKETLCGHYGRARGESLFAKHIGAKGGDVSAAKLRALVREGDAQVTDRAHLVGVALRGHIQTLSNIPAGTPAAAVGMRVANKVVTTVVRANEILGQEPMNQPEISQTLTDLQSEINKIDLQLQALASLPDELAVFRDQAATDLGALRGQLDNQMGLLRDRLQSCPTTNANVGHALGLMYDSAIQTVDGLMNRPGLPNRDWWRLDALRGELEALKGAAVNIQADPHQKADGRRIKSLSDTPKQLTKLISGSVSGMRFSEGGALRAYSVKDLGKMINAAHIEMLNGGPWTEVSRNVSVKTSAGQARFTSVLQPATTMNHTLAASYGGRGVCCHSTSEATHAVNLVQTELRLPGQPAPVFKALRHGVHCAYGIRDRQARQAANDARVNECLVGALSADQALLNRALGGETVYLPITSVSLLTPDGFRDGSDDHETLYLAEQNEAWLRASHGQRQLTIIGHDGQPHQVRVQPQVITFNFGVNAGAQGSVAQYVAGGWDVSSPMNYRAMVALIGSVGTNDPIGGAVGAFLAGPAPDAQKEQVRELAAQVKNLWGTGAYKDSGKNPYLLPARLLVLANLIGQTPAFNCKSGKDRTGQLDVEAKTLAAQIRMLGHVPTLAQSSSDDYKRIREQFVIDGGNHEIQRMNTGLAGFKTKGVRGLDAIYRNTGALLASLGLSKYVHS